MKPLIAITGVQFRQVAPHAGAWIETSVGLVISILSPVAPHAGAWIETNLEKA